jgi:phosphoribosylglycinamide formyltransferase-1
MRIGVLASHEGSVLQAVIDACSCGRINGEIKLVISNNSASGAILRAARAQIPTAHLSSATHADSEALDRAICDRLVQAEIDLVLLAGYMKKLGPLTLTHYQRRIVNTHPALLPKFGGRGYFGRRVHEAVLAAGEVESGATVHWVEGEYDTGPIIAQARVPLAPQETVASLEATIKALERDLLIDTLSRLAQTSIFRKSA